MVYSPQGPNCCFLVITTHIKPAVLEITLFRKQFYPYLDWHEAWLNLPVCSHSQHILAAFSMPIICCASVGVDWQRNTHTHTHAQNFRKSGTCPRGQLHGSLFWKSVIFVLWIWVILVLSNRFNLVGYGCMTCIGNSGPLAEPVVEAIEKVGNKSDTYLVCSISVLFMCVEVFVYHFRETWLLVVYCQEIVTLREELILTQGPTIWHLLHCV